MLNIILILLSLLAFLIYAVIFLNNRFELSNIESLIKQSDKPTEQFKKGIKTFAFEDKFLKILKIKPDSFKLFLFIERIVIFSIIVVVFVIFKGFALLILGGLITIGIFNDMEKKVIYESGITNIPRVVNFINYFIPHITSGNSAEQSLIQYIDYAVDEELNEYYQRRDDEEYIMPIHLKQIVEIYKIAKYNEDKGNSDYVYILEELAQDIAQKQVYYNKFVSHIGEIGPTVWSYYIGVPTLIIASFSQTQDFWAGIGGYLVSIALLALFLIFKFLIYKLKKDTVNVIF